ncbi:hypothetical protein BDZ94DRAFT_1255017 [Collybia nuda]|uniref:BZIP domain-containing protein n=1 Tax=Collybia nuda TaxID=64659 RepID=A0A9P5YAA1_9AGAR|nr:hypothetical protein BDZ94DRAFT_1255017 [Collybia nuda]
MARHPPSLPMSHIIACDAPLLSPVSLAPEAAPWDIQSIYSPTPDTFSHYYIPPSPPNSVGSSRDSPIPASRMLKMRMTPDSAADTEQLCLPTHQVFDFPEATQPPMPPSPAESSPKQERLSISIAPSSTSSSKRSASPAPGVSKKQRSAGERINSKDFIPPDVSGLSKREARLVKNRAAAFLSRQRKREEFECMEIRVAELEQENARLLALTQSGNSISCPDNTSDDGEFVSEIEQLRAQLAAAKARELELSAELATKALAPVIPAIKVEAPETQVPMVTPSRTSAPSPHRSGASLGLMQVLLCALPTLLSMPMHSTTPTSFAIPNPLPAPSTAFDFNSFLPNDYDWTRTGGSSLMELDTDDHTQLSAPTPMVAPTARKLEFADENTDNIGGLGGLDISFDTTPSDNGKIRVRIHPSSSASSRAASPGVSYSDSKADMASPSSLGMWGDSEIEPSLAASFSSQPYAGSSLSYPPPPSPGGDPFLGIGSTSDYSMPYSSGVSSSSMFGQMDDLSTVDYGQTSDLGYGSEYGSDGTSNGKRRVRIALKSMPAAGGEGGEWEVQFC